MMSGWAINPVLVEGQVEGGIAQGIGMTLMERIYSRSYGKFARLSNSDFR